MNQAVDWAKSFLVYHYKNVKVIGKIQIKIFVKQKLKQIILKQYISDLIAGNELSRRSSYYLWCNTR